MRIALSLPLPPTWADALAPWTAEATSEVGLQLSLQTIPCATAAPYCVSPQLETQDMPQDMHKADPEVVSHNTPLRAVRQHCLSCCNDSYNEVRRCGPSGMGGDRTRRRRQPLPEDPSTRSSDA